MIELIYPYDLAPLVPAPTAETAFERDANCEYLPVVEPNGVVTGRSSRSYCHLGTKVLHPVVHLHIIDRMGRLYLQKRPLNKKIQPGKWDTAVGGHVSYGESLLEALYREASEELGMTAFHPVYLKSYEYESEVEKELINVFAAVGNFTPHPDGVEVSEGRWWEMDEVEDAYGRGILTPNLESELDMIRGSLLALL